MCPTVKTLAAFVALILLNEFLENRPVDPFNYLRKQGNIAHERSDVFGANPKLLFWAKIRTSLPII
jgi:hypothetical protein